MISYSYLTSRPLIFAEATRRYLDVGLIFSPFNFYLDHISVCELCSDSSLQKTLMPISPVVTSPDGAYHSLKVSFVWLLYHFIWWWWLDTQFIFGFNIFHIASCRAMHILSRFEHYTASLKLLSITNKAVNGAVVECWNFRMLTVDNNSNLITNHRQFLLRIALRW